jgi:hypothetical protein
MVNSVVVMIPMRYEQTVLYQETDCDRENPSRERIDIPSPSLTYINISRAFHALENAPTVGASMWKVKDKTARNL